MRQCDDLGCLTLVCIDGPTPCLKPGMGGAGSTFSCKTVPLTPDRERFGPARLEERTARVCIQDGEFQDHKAEFSSAFRVGYKSSGGRNLRVEHMKSFDADSEDLAKYSKDVHNVVVVMHGLIRAPGGRLIRFRERGVTVAEYLKLQFASTVPPLVLVLFVCGIQPDGTLLRDVEQFCALHQTTVVLPVRHAGEVVGLTPKRLWDPVVKALGVSSAYTEIGIFDALELFSTNDSRNHADLYVVTASGTKVVGRAKTGDNRGESKRHAIAAHAAAAASMLVALSTPSHAAAGAAARLESKTPLSGLQLATMKQSAAVDRTDRASDVARGSFCAAAPAGAKACAPTQGQGTSQTQNLLTLQHAPIAMDTTDDNFSCVDAVPLAPTSPGQGLQKWTESSNSRSSVTAMDVTVDAVPEAKLLEVVASQGGSSSRQDGRLVQAAETKPQQQSPAPHGFVGRGQLLQVPPLPPFAGFPAFASHGGSSSRQNERLIQAAETKMQQQSPAPGFVGRGQLLQVPPVSPYPPGFGSPGFGAGSFAMRLPAYTMYAGEASPQASSVGFFATTTMARGSKPRCPKPDCRGNMRFRSRDREMSVFSCRSCWATTCVPSAPAQ